MAALNFNLLGFAFQQGVDWLATGFATAAVALAEQPANLRSDLAAYEASVAAGGERIGEWEDGLRLCEQDQVFEMQIGDAEESLMDLRKAYVLAAYHHWERSARRWSRASNNARHGQLAAATSDLGYPVDARLDAVRDLANTLKHNNATWAAKLFASWPELLNADPVKRPEMDWYGLIELADRHLHEVCEIIRRSGPNGQIMPLRTAGR